MRREAHFLENEYVKASGPTNWSTRFWPRSGEPCRSGTELNRRVVDAGRWPYALIERFGGTIVFMLFAICWASRSLSSRATNHNARSSPLVTPPLVTRSPSSTTRSGTTTTPTRRVPHAPCSACSRGDTVMTRRGPTTWFRCRRRPSPSHSSRLRRAVRQFTLLVLRPRSCFERAFQPPPATMTISASPE